MLQFIFLCEHYYTCKNRPRAKVLQFVCCRESCYPLNHPLGFVVQLITLHCDLYSILWCTDGSEKWNWSQTVNSLRGVSSENPQLDVGGKHSFGVGGRLRDWTLFLTFVHQVWFVFNTTNKPLFEGVLESRMYVSYRKPVELFVGLRGGETAHDIFLLRPTFAHLTPQFTPARAAKDRVTPTKASRICPQMKDFNQIGSSSLEST